MKAIAKDLGCVLLPDCNRFPMFHLVLIIAGICTTFFIFLLILSVTPRFIFLIWLCMKAVAYDVGCICLLDWLGMDCIIGMGNWN